MSRYILAHHKIIESALNNFNADFLRQHNIMFGGGTRIALELDEYRESVDIDFLCPDKESYRAVRNEVTNVSLGKIVKKDFNYVREITFDRYAVRVVFVQNNANIKLEFVSFDNYNLMSSQDSKFPIPSLDRESCFYTKLLANADRANKPPYKDIFDILAMISSWGDIPETAIAKAEEHYGDDIKRKLIASLEHMMLHKKEYYAAAESMRMDPDLTKEIIENQAPLLFGKFSENSL